MAEIDVSISVVTPCYNRKRDVLELIRCLSNQDYDNFEIIIVDDCSNDKTDEAVQTQYPEIRYIKLARNSGPAIARNTGIACARGDIIVGIDSDVLIEDSQFLKKINSLLDASKNLSCVACRIINYYTQRDDSGRWWHPLDIASHCARPFWTDYFSGTGYAFRREVFDRAGLYPTDLFMDMEENDLSYRILEAGFDIRYSPEVQVIHKAPEMSRNNRITFYFKRRNQFWVACRYFPWWRVPLYIAPRFLLTGIASVRHKQTMLYCKSVWDAIKEIPAVAKTRKPLSKQTWKKINRIHKGLYDTNRAL